MSVAIGIDLGTTNTVVAAVVDGVAVTLEDDKGRRLLPSVVSFQPNGAVLVGEAAREKRPAERSESTIFSVKPLLGRAWDSPETQNARARFPFTLQPGAKNATMVEARGTLYALPEISAFVLRRAKAIAEAALQQPVERAVITVPANFNDLQRASTKIAGKLAGLDVMRILNEPTAAALAYGQSIKGAEKIAVYDLGGGTFDITLLDLTNSVFEVLATAGDTALGGDDVDRVIADRIIKEVKAKLKLDPRGHPASIARIGFLAEEIKKELSSAERFERELSGVAHKSNGTPMSIPFRLTRTELEQLAKPLLDRTVTVAQQSMTSVGLTTDDFERVILVGGATRMPLVARIVEGLFGKPPHLKVNPDEVVALGAAIQAHALNRSKAAHKAPPKPPPLPVKAPAAAARPVPPHIAQVRPPSAPKMNAVRAPGSSQKLPAFRPASSSSKMPAVRPASTPPKMGAVRPVPRSHSAASRLVKVAAAEKPPSQPTGGGSAKAAARAASAGREEQARGGESRRAAAAEIGARVLLVLEGRARRYLVGSPRATVAAKPAAGSRAAASAVAGPPPAARRVRRGRVPIDLSSISPTCRAARHAGPVDRHRCRAARSRLRPRSAVDVRGSVAAHARAAFARVAARLRNATRSLAAADHSARARTSRQGVAPERFEEGSAIATSAQTPLLIDVTPLSLGVETVGGYADVLIPANSPVP